MTVRELRPVRLHRGDAGGPRGDGRAARGAAAGRFNGLGTYTQPQPPRDAGDRAEIWAATESFGAFWRRVMNLPFYRALAFTLAFTFVVTPLVLMLGLAIALAVNSLPKLKGPTIFFSLLPMIVTPLIGSLVLRG
jgi:ABC-type sugar transport system permease subunit